MSLATETPGQASIPVDTVIGGKMGGIQKGSRERAFSRRLEQALDNHPRCPSDYGRLTWVTRELAHQRVNVTIETVRRWLHALSIPRAKSMSALAKILEVDETWLAMGRQEGSVHLPALKVELLRQALLEIEQNTDDPKIREIIERTKDQMDRS